MLMLSVCWLMLATFFFPRLAKIDDDARVAPEFPKVEAARWLNSPPLKMADLRGKVILLDVWTFM